MTISYSLDVSKARFCGFAKLLARWKGSIYKILWREFLIFCLAYTVISVLYRNSLNGEQKIVFEKVVIFVDGCTDFIPLSFVLGFYVSLVIGRWWGQYETIPWPDKLGFMIGSYVHGSDERSRMIRRTLGRYVILSQVLTFQCVSTAVKRRFPTPKHLVAAGIMTKEELSVYNKISFRHGKWWLPCHWFSGLATRARKEGRIKDSVLLNALLQEIYNFRTSCAIMFGYDWVSVPLVYTQVVTLATYAYSLALIVGRQYLDPAKGYPKNDIDLYVPFFTLLQFFFYIGWLKVAEQILNPYGEDEDDFELNWCLDRTVHLVYLAVDNLQLQHPKVSKDAFWDELDIVLPQTRHSAKFSTHTQLGSAFSLNVQDAEYLPLDSYLEQDKEENIYKSNSVKGDNHRPSLIRRLLSSGFGQSRRRKAASNESSLNNAYQSQGFVNPVFEATAEKNMSSILKTSVSSSNSSLNNYTKPSPSHSRIPSVSFRKNSLILHRCKTYDLQDAERLNRFQAPNICADGSSGSTILPVSRTISAPLVINSERWPSPLPEPEEVGDCLEMDSEEQKLDNFMSCIPEETSRAASLASIEAGALKTMNTPMKRLEEVQNLVHEANKVLEELKRSVSDDGTGTNTRQESCESCYAKINGHSSSSEENEEDHIKNVIIDEKAEISIDIDTDSAKRHEVLTATITK